jgi:hypothetical protein
MKVKVLQQEPFQLTQLAVPSGRKADQGPAYGIYVIERTYHRTLYGLCACLYAVADKAIDNGLADPGDRKSVV